MKLLYLGDVVGINTVKLIRKHLPDIKEELCCDVVIANGENAANVFLSLCFIYKI